MTREVPTTADEPGIRPWPPSGGLGAGPAVLVLLGAQLVAVVWASFVAVSLYGGTIPPLAERPIWTLPLFNVGLWAGYLAGPFLVGRLTGDGPPPRPDLRVGPREGAIAVAAGVGTQLVLLPALYWALLKVVSGDPGATAEALADRVDGPADVLWLTLSVAIMAPLAEEWFYRGTLLPALGRRFGVVGGLVASSLVFALIHQEPILIPGLFVIAAILAWLTIRTGRLGPAVLAHLAFNATTLVQLLAF